MSEALGFSKVSFVEMITAKGRMENRHLAYNLPSELDLSAKASKRNSETVNQK